MRKLIVLFAFSLVTAFKVSSQSSEDRVAVVTGKMMKLSDSTVITGDIRYEKLPYYDDMGLTQVQADGTYRLELLAGNTYTISVTKDGYKKYSQELVAAANQRHDIYVKEDLIELRKLENLIFSRGSDRITESSHQELDQLASWLSENPSIVIQLEGHTDFDGNADANMRLSEARVMSVKEYLIDKGVKKNRIFTKAFGGTQPLTQERTDEAKARNRRVEARVISR